MTKLVVRKIPWEFDPSVPFVWQPTNVAAEVDLFLRQEAQHAAAHRKHMIALVQRYPKLEQCYEDACQAYDDLIDEQPIEFHAAYIANLEATFTPLFKVILDNRDSLFGAGDQRVASLIMWHFVEEIEHRSSGLRLCRHINPNPWYRVKHIRATFSHVGRLSQAIAKTFDEVIMLRRPCSTPCRPANWSQWCGDWRCRRCRIMIRLTNRCRTGRTPGCANTNGALT